MKLSHRPDHSLEIDTLGAAPLRVGKSRSLALFWALCLVASSTMGLSASARDALEISLSAERVTIDSQGVESLSEEGMAQPGDTLQYRATYINRTDRALGNLAPTLPIPVGTEYIASASAPAPSEASLDGKIFEHLPIVRRDQAGREIILPAASYRALRWQAGTLEGNQTRIITARVKLSASK